ncbi:MAG: chemotaxis-specific protein-glutamate methyltransferase CheB [Acidobacteria bacterium]|nr:chemotaxis-specific protein-glutamate methyltransferase CheB [Acidobacteriota bacterium]
MIRVLIVEDSPIIVEFLQSILTSDPGIEVVGAVRTGEAALEAVKRYRPDVITMDIHMPGMNGFEATRQIMETVPTPIIIVSGNVTPEESAVTFQALEAGALMVLPRPSGIGHSDHELTAQKLVQSVKLMSEVKVVRRWPRSGRKKVTEIRSIELERKPEEPIRLVAIGASTGGPQALQIILQGLPSNFSAPVVIVQHMATGFIQSFAEWLGQSCALPVQIAVHEKLLQPGRVYIAPDGYQVEMEPGDRLGLRACSAETHHCPSVSVFFRSVAKVNGRQVVGILLSGMGADGAAELKLLRERGAITIVQDEKSSVVFGMPGKAVSLGAAQYVLNPGQIAQYLKELNSGNPNPCFSEG